MLTSILRAFLDHTSEKTRARFKALLLLLSARRIRSVIVLESQQLLPLAQLGEPRQLLVTRSRSIRDPQARTNKPTKISGHEDRNFDRSILSSI